MSYKVCLKVLEFHLHVIISGVKLGLKNDVFWESILPYTSSTVEEMDTYEILRFDLEKMKMF